MPLPYLTIPLAIIIGYLFGSFPSAYIVVRAMCGIDIRTVGSGNVGATNTSRVAGAKGTVVVLLLDIIKGVIPTFAAFKIGGLDLGLLSGICAMLGHLFPVWLGFKGGKGVATLFGVVVSLSPASALIAIGAWLLIILITRYVSLATIIGVIVFEMMIIIYDYGILYIAAMGIMMAYIIFRHRDNIKRLLSGTEYKFGEKVK